MSDFYLYKIGTEALASGFLIVVVDGTASMGFNYELLVTAHNTVFKERIQNKSIYTIQFGESITGLEPFQCAQKGNFNEAFITVIHKINQIKDLNITICVISDGEEQISFEELRESVKKIDKNTKQIQFTSIAVGQQYPFKTFQTFREIFHNGAASCTNVQVISNLYPEPSQRPAQLAEFIKAFQVVVSQVNQQSKVILTQPASSTLQGKLAFKFNQGEIVYSPHPSVKANNGQIIRTSKPEDINQIVKTSLQEMIKDQANKGYTSVSQQGQQIQQVAQVLVQKMEQTDKFTTGNIARDLMTLDNIVQGELKLQNFEESQITQLLSEFNPKPDEDLQKKQKEEFESLDVFVTKGITIFKQQELKIHEIQFWPLISQERSSQLYDKVKKSGSEILIKKLNQLQYDQHILDQLEQGELNLHSLNDSDMKELSSCFASDFQTKEEQQQQAISRLVNLIKQKRDVRDEWMNLFLLDESIDFANTQNVNKIFDCFVNLNDCSMLKLKDQMNTYPEFYKEFINMHLQMDQQ